MTQTSQTPAVLIMANDRIAPELLRLLTSLRRHAPDLTVRVMPFNDEFTLCAGIAKSLGCEVVGGDLSRYEQLGRDLFDDDPPQQPYPYMLGKMRKLWLFDQPEPMAYIDADTIITSDLAALLRKAMSAEFDLGYVSVSNGWIYEQVPAAADLLSRTRGFSSGFLLKRTNRVTFADIASLLRSSRSHYHMVRRRGVVDQPLLNYVFDRVPAKVVCLADVLGISTDTVATHDLPWFTCDIAADGKVTSKGLPVLYLHAVGQYKHSAEYDLLFKGHLMDGLCRVSQQDPAFGATLFHAVMNWVQLN